MIVTSKFEVDLTPGENRRKNNADAVPILAVQGDTDTHAVEIALYEDGQVWKIPEGASAVVGYAHSNGTGGIYDTLSDGTAACSISGNVVTAVIASQMLAQSGNVWMTVSLLHGDQKLTVLEKMFQVRRDMTLGMPAPEAYINMQQWVRSVVPEVAQELGTDKSAVMSQQVVTDALLSAVQPSPGFVNSISECTDPASFYVLPDGYIYAYMKQYGAMFTNLADCHSADWAYDSRLNSSAEVVEYPGAVVTNWIEATGEDVIRVKGMDILDAKAGYIMKDEASGKLDSLKCVSYPDDITRDEEGVTSYTIWYQNGVQSSIASETTRIRLSGVLTGSAADVIITKNQQIRYGDVCGWHNTGRVYRASDHEERIQTLEEVAAENSADLQQMNERVDALEAEQSAMQLPDYWQAYLPGKIDAIHTLQQAGGKDCFSFPLLTDIHISMNLGKRSGLLAKALMDGCDIPYALCLGDVVTRGADKTAESMDESFAEAEALLAPIRDRLLQTQGNHDGSWGAEDLDADGDVEGAEYYCHNFIPQKLHRLIYRKVGLMGQVHFDADGCGYYYDDVSNKVRYILLNSHHNTYTEREDGTALYNNMRIFRFGQSQYDLVIEALTTVPGTDWAVVTASHAPLNEDYASLFGGSAGDHVLMRRLLAAYKNKTAFSGSFAGTYADDAVQVTADFTDAKGQYVAHFAGHSHVDSSGVYDGITVVTTRCDGKEENDEAMNAERVTGTVTEQSFDIFTVNRSTRTIHATKIGAGDDRVISY